MTIAFALPPAAATHQGRETMASPFDETITPCRRGWKSTPDRGEEGARPDHGAGHRYWPSQSTRRPRAKAASARKLLSTMPLATVLGLALLGSPPRALAKGRPGGSQAPAPIVAAVSPDSGSYLGGTAITIGGSNFQRGATVSLGNVEATAVTVINSTKIAAITAPHAPGIVIVTVRNLDLQSGCRGLSFTYTGSPAPEQLQAAHPLGPDGA
jgi:hypothetical protein